MEREGDNRSLGDLFAELARETSTLVRQEVKLAEAEMGDKITRAARHVATMVVGGALIYAGLLAIIAAVILAIGAAGVPWWFAALLVGVLIAAGGYLLVSQARAGLKQADVMPNRTIETLKEDREWAKEQIG